MGLRRGRIGLRRLQVGKKICQILHFHPCIGGEWEYWVEMPALALAVYERVGKLFLCPLSKAMFRMGRNIGAIESPERSLHRRATGKEVPTFWFGMTTDAAGKPEHISTASSIALDAGKIWGPRWGPSK